MKTAKLLLSLTAILAAQSAAHAADEPWADAFTNALLALAAPVVKESLPEADRETLITNLKNELDNDDPVVKEAGIGWRGGFLIAPRDRQQMIFDLTAKGRKYAADLEKLDLKNPGNNWVTHGVWDLINGAHQTVNFQIAQAVDRKMDDLDSKARAGNYRAIYNEVRGFRKYLADNFRN